jgi:prepilin-type N-terminal cleavage/methylation domain-containing protein/prepilin-type processing-associated H-X9-DG protein
VIKSRGFTLIELLVVLAIIAALAGIGYPVTHSFIAKSREAACLGNLRSLGVALQSYLQDYQDKMPELATARASKTDDLPVIETLLLPYLETPDAFQCPADKKQFEKTGSSYLWNSTQNGLHVSQLSFFGIKDRPDKIPLITDKESWHPGGTNFLYADLSSSNKPRFSAGN